MIEHSFFNYISPLKSYPVKLAQKIGCQEATLWYNMFITYGTGSFLYKEELGVLLGVLKVRDVFDKLVLLEYIKEDEDQLNAIDTRYKLNIDIIISDAECGLGEIKPPFTSLDFSFLLKKWTGILRSKGRKVNLKVIYGLFVDKSLAESIRALTLSCNNQWVTLKFDDTIKLQGNNGGNPIGHSGRIGGSGGGCNEEVQGTYKPREAGEI